MKLLDSNIVIYAGKPGFDFLHPLLAEPDVAVSRGHAGHAQHGRL